MILDPRPEPPSVGTPTSVVVRTPVRRSKKKAKSFRRGINEVFDTLQLVGSRKAARVLASLPPIDAGLSDHFRDHCEDALGDIPRCPNWDYWDLSGTKIDVCMLGRVFDDDGEEGWQGDTDLAVPGTIGWWVGRFRSASMRTLRGRALKQPHPNLSRSQARKGYVPPARDPLYTANVVIADHVARVDAEGKAHAFSTLLVSPNGQDWKMLTPNGMLLKDVELERLTRAVHGMEWGNRFLWSVVIRRGSLPPLRIHVTARNVLEFLWMRDSEERRRKAMIHLVRPHQRRLPSGKTTTVRPHLRGSTSCDWKGWQVSITPSEHDESVLAEKMLPGQDMMDFIETNCGLLDTGEERGTDVVKR
jgi:hypothetical protein